MVKLVKVILYKHGIGYFEREGTVEGEAVVSLTFKQREVADVLKSLTVLDLDGGQVTSVSYDSTRPLEQLLQEVDLNIPDQNSLTGLLPQLKGARLAMTSGGERVEGILLGIDTIEEQTAAGVVSKPRVSVLTDAGEVRGFDLIGLGRLEILDPKLRDDLSYYLRTLLSARKKDARTFSFFASGEGQRRVRMSYTLEAPVWKATYRLLLGGEGEKPLIQGWAVVDNTQDEDWEDVELSLVSGLPVSFVHDLYTPRYIQRPVVAVQETTGVLPPMVESAVPMMAMAMDDAAEMEIDTMSAPAMRMGGSRGGYGGGGGERRKQAASSTPAQVRERKLGDLFEYAIDHAVTIRRNQSALVPIVLRPFDGRMVLLYNRDSRKDNPLRAVEFHNTTGLTLEGGPVTVLEGGDYVGEAMLDTLKPDEERLVPYAVELSVRVSNHTKTHKETLSRVILRNQTLTTRSWQQHTTTYTIDNTADREYTLFLEHPRGDAAWELLEPAKPHATTENFWRFKLTLAPKRATEFVVQVRLPVQQARMLGNMLSPDFAYWIDQKYLDGPTRNLLSRIAAMQDRLGVLSRQTQELEAERNAIHQEQGRIRENLQALGDRPSEKEFRERLVRTLNEQEDRLNQIRDAIKSHREEALRLTEERNALVTQLDVEASI